MKKREEVPLVTFLEKMKDNRAAMARLRRGLGKEGGTSDMYPYVVPYIPVKKDDDEWKWRRTANQHFLIASLFALHPDSAGRGSSMGKVFRAMMSSSPNIEKRFENLLDVDSEELGGHLRQAIFLAKSKNVWVDFHQLFHDIWLWNKPDRRVQLRWAREFWGYEKEAIEKTTEL